VKGGAGGPIMTFKYDSKLVVGLGGRIEHKRDNGE